MHISKLLSGAALSALTLATTAAFAQDMTISVMGSQNWINEPELEIARQFEAETGIKVDFQAIPDDQYHSVLKARLNSGEAADIFMGQSGYSDLLSYNITETAVDLSAEDWVDRVQPLVREAASMGDEFYGLTYWPSGVAPFIYNYNIELFERHGVEIPRSFDALLDVCSVFKEAGITPIYEPFGDGWHHVLMFAHSGPKMADATEGLFDQLNANEAVFEGNAAMIENLEQIKTLYDSGCFGDNVLSDLYAGTPKAFVNEEVAIVHDRASFFSAVLGEYPDYDVSNIGAFPVPLSDNQYVTINPAGPTKFVFAGGENIDAAKQYLAYLMREDVLETYMSLPGAPSNLPFIGTPSGLPDGIQAVIDENEDMKRVVMQTAVTYFNPQWMDIGQDMTAMMTGMFSANDILRNIDKRRANMAGPAGDPAWQ